MTTALSDVQKSAGPEVSPGDEALLVEIRNRKRFLQQYWQDAHDERETDIRYLNGDPWTEGDRKARNDAGRPCINHDELNQYVNQAVNSARQNKRGIKIEPEGNGANDKTAEFREDLTRTIEYRSKAISIYLQAYQDEIEGGYGFCRVSRRYLHNDTDEQEIVIRPIPNPDSVLYAPECKEPDWSDATDCFVLDPMPRKEFERQWPDADIVSFTSDDSELVDDWITEESVLVAEYWKLVKTRRKGKTGRMVDDVKLMQYITNGVEILEKNEQLGEELPIVPFIGLQRFCKDGGQVKRQLFSLIRFARDPQMSLAYLCSLEMEEAGLTPKSPYKGYVGQFETDADGWKNLTKIPRAFIQVDPVTDGANTVLPLPQREQFTPNFQQYEIAKDAARRAVQAAMGISPLPTSAQRQNEKSGVALQRIQAQQEIGSFHFMDGYERAVARIGRIVDSQISATYGDGERTMSLRKADDSRRVVVMNPKAPPAEDSDIDGIEVGDEDHAVTISTGPSADSQRDAADDFLDLLVGNIATLPVAPPQKAKLLAMAIQMKQLGPKGDEMAQIISPDDNQQLPPQAQQALGTAQQHIQALNAYSQKLEAELQQLKMEQQAKVIENQGKMSIEQFRAEVDLAKAEITTKSQSLEERLKFVEDAWKQLHSQAHEAGLQAVDQSHAQDMAQQQAEAAQAQQAQAAQQQGQPTQDQQ